MDYEEKKKLLSQYCILKNEIIKILDELEELKSSPLRSFNFSEKVSGGELSNIVENSVERVEFLEDKLLEKVKKSKEVYKILDSAFKNLSCTEYEIMTNRFFQGLKWEKIAEKINKESHYIMARSKKVILRIPDEYFYMIKEVMNNEIIRP